MVDRPPRETRQLSVIRKPAPKTRAVFHSEGAPLFRGDGPLDFVCGGCREVLIAGVEQGQVRSIVIRCPACGCYNDTLD